MRFLVFFLSAVLFAPVGADLALAHEHHEHHEMAHDAQMQKLHAMMPMFATASADIKAAIGKKDAAAVDAATGKVIAAIPDLKKSKPHKHASQRKKFVQLAGQLGAQAKTVADNAKKGDYGAAGNALSQLSATCDACHATYQD